MTRHAPIVGILAVAALARFWAIDFCLPSTLCRPDEEAVAAVSTYFFDRHFNPHFFDWPSLFMYVVSVALIPLFKVGLWLGWYRGEKHFLQMIVLDPSPVFLTARLLSATAGTLTVWLVYRIACRLRGETAGLIAALFLALAFLHARDSHFGVTDITATCLVMLAFLFTVRFAQAAHQGRPYDVLCAAFIAGLATATKYNAALIGLPILFMVIRSPKQITQVFGLMFAGFFVGSPFVVIDYAASMKALGEISSHLSGGHGVNVGRGWIVHLASSLRYGLGLPLLIAGIAGLFLGIAQRWREGVMLAIFPITYYLVIGSGYTVFARYILPVVPFLCLAAAIAVTEAASLVRARAALASWALALLVIAPSAWSVFQFDRLLARTDSRVLAENWVMRQFPNGAQIGEMGRGSTKLHFVPPQPGVPSPYKTLAVDEDPGEPDVLVIPISLFDPTAQVSAPAALLKARYTLAETVRAHAIRSAPQNGAPQVVYDWQDEFYLPLTGFVAIERPGPNYEIYLRCVLCVR